MAFWGIEVRPGKPVTHPCEKARGRLRVSQATLGIGDNVRKTILQCNVGKKRPVLLCVLLPDKTESCHLDLEFGEADDVVFSVIGPRNIYLTGYYVRQSHRSNPDSDTESYGVDIQSSHTDGSSHCSDDDEYEDSFIDDDEELQVCSPSPVSSNQGMAEITPEDNKPKARHSCDTRVRKKRQVVESDSDANSHESEDGGSYLLSVFKSKKGAEKILADAGEKIAHENSKEKEDHEEDHADLNGKPEGAKLKKKRRESSKGGKTREAETDKDHIILREDTAHQAETPNNLPESGSESRKKSKKRRKEQHIDNSLSTNSELLANGSQVEKASTKKVKKKTQSEGKSGIDLSNMADSPDNTAMEVENQATEAKPIRTLSNGLIIAQVANGPPDGKVAAQGKRVKIYYTGMLKENAHIFDSNVGKDALKFRLGQEGVIDGWNIGIEGMHVGDKRRLIIPPSLGFGKRQVEENVPPNSWLVYDVELVAVRK